MGARVLLETGSAGYKPVVRIRDDERWGMGNGVMVEGRAERGVLRRDGGSKG